MMCITNFFKCSFLISLIFCTTTRTHSTEIRNNAKLLYSEQEIVEVLVKKWSPLVWLAPNERFMPGNVKTFLSHVHAEREKPSNKKIKDIGDNLGKYSQYYRNNGFEDLIYYENSQRETSTGPTTAQNNRKRRNFDKRQTSLEYIFELPINDASENWYMVTNDELDNLMKNDTSFIFGENPDEVSIYAVVNMCSNGEDLSFKNEIESNNIAKFQYKKNPYIPLIKSPHVYKFDNSQPNIVNIFDDNESNKEMQDEVKKIEKMPVVKIIRRKRRQLNETIQSQTKVNEMMNKTNMENLIGLTMSGTNDSEWKAVSSPKNVIIYTKDNHVVLPTLASDKAASDKASAAIANSQEIPHFHVSYWMFYPYSQGKTICTLNLGPLGPWPIPLIFNMCLGTRKEFGSHVGDWEHMSLHFKGRMEPDEMYVSAHDAGAYYTFDRLTGTFEFKSQETRKGLLQQPVFPKTVITSENHPVLFSAEGSHGLWATPGKHRFVRVPRLYDVNGFGIPWQTWKNVEMIYNDERGKRSVGGSSSFPNWMKYRGKWGNPKTKCHPLKRIGLHVCELTDGPSGIPKKVSHFKCSK